MELRQLKTFLAVAGQLNFNRAAEALAYSQSTVSAQIKALEDDFGQPLFDRLGKRVALTEAGQTLLRYAQKMVALEHETIAQVGGRQAPRGLLSVRVPQSIATVYLPEVIAAFQKTHPRISLDIATCAFHTLLQELQSGVTDVAFLLTDTIGDRQLNAEALAVEQLVLAAHPDHALAARPAVRAEDLKGQTLLLPKHDCAYRMVFEQLLSDRQVGDATIIELNSIEAIINCLLRGIGVAILPQVVLQHQIGQRHLKALAWAEGPLEAAVLMIWHKDKWLSPALRGFMDAARAVIGNATASSVMASTPVKTTIVFSGTVNPR